MTDPEIKLECLKLARQHVPQDASIILVTTLADQYYNYVHGRMNKRLLDEKRSLQEWANHPAAPWTPYDPTATPRYTDDLKDFPVYDKHE
jgi:UDP-galactopyranose mutase